MKLVFEKFDSTLYLRRDAVNVLRIEDRSLYSRCALSLAQGFPADSLEPAFFFDDSGHEVKASRALYFAGDILAIDLNDKRILSAAVKTILARMTCEGDCIGAMEGMNCRIEEVFEGQFDQMNADYCFSESWDGAKYLKMVGFGIDDAGDRTVFDRLTHFVRICADLFPESVIAFVNVPTYLTDEQYNEFCELVAAQQLCVLSYEQGSGNRFGDFENGLYIDADYLEE
ncbi:MAG: type II-A CRISPR-associated protein Csn2 [Slackia sp.]|nr:type II-A CRISPR-associated protein Csn2 [Slackia sp.]